ncbi:MAG: hypothetical protein JWO20_2563 [Candidatus Angelobacter sp.]|nr:hypothetical protein [Candidatus Angelobacter sp.]
MRFANIVLPEPGGPIIRMLCPPADETSSARFAVCCPRTSLKSTAKCWTSASSAAVSTVTGVTPFPVFRKCTTSISDFTG